MKLLFPCSSPFITQYSFCIFLTVGFREYKYNNVIRYIEFNIMLLLAAYFSCSVIYTSLESQGFQMRHLQDFTVSGFATK